MSVAFDTRLAALGAAGQAPRFGPLVAANGTTFRLWAPQAREAELLLDGREAVPMERIDDGFFAVCLDDCGYGTRYRFRVGDLVFPDLASRRQEGGTAGWSVVQAPLGPSSDRPLRPWHETILCEVHVGTVTPEGTFSALRDRLEHFRDAGYTALELMPVNEFPGNRNWGYDGTLIFAPDSAYGTPEELRALVDRAHELGLCLVLDVVYNHFGEVDNFVADYAPRWFNDDVETPWGPGINFDEPMVRRFYYENAAMWLGEYDFDGLRFDSVHEMRTEARDQFLGELAKACRAAKDHAKLIIENVENTATWLERRNNRPVNFVAQWNDDIHHVLNHLVTGERKGGYGDDAKDPFADLEKALADGFVHDGEAEGESGGHTRGEPGSLLPPDAFITFVQNHDQIGNRADGKRLPDRISADKLDFLHFLACLAPQIPLFFMGEEAHLRSPFPFFVDLEGEAAEAKSRDRYDQMRRMFDQDVAEGDLPEPSDEATFEMAKLDWEELARDDRRAALARFRQLTGFRRDLVWPLTGSVCLDATSRRAGTAIAVDWVFEAGSLSMVLNPSDAPAQIAAIASASSVSTGEVSQAGRVLHLGPWSAVAWTHP